MILNRKGFTLGEVLASLIALGIITLTVQSLILVANNFLSQQSSSMSSLQEQTFFSKLICHKFQRPVFVEQDRSRSFEYHPYDGFYKKKKNTRPNPNHNPATLSVPLLDKSNTTGISNLGSSLSEHPAVQAFLNTALTFATNKDDTNKVLRAHINDKANIDPLEIENASGSHDYNSLFYDIYADNHTLPTFMVKQTEEDGIRLGKVSEGFIYASRCIKNGKANLGTEGSFISIEGKYPTYSIIDRIDKNNMNDDGILATALYILEQKWRPFYFPDQAKVKDQVICCNITQFNRPTTITLGNSPTPTIPAGCGNLETYTPVIYVIKISSDGGALEDLIPANDSLEGFLQASVDDTTANEPFESHTACAPSGGLFKIDLAGVNASTTSCETVVRNNYFSTLGKRFAHPIKFENVEELPLVKKDRVNSWAYGFVAPNFKNQDMHKEFKIISIENKCHSSLPIGLCGKAVPGLNLDITVHPENAINGKSVAEYFIAKVSACPFNYITMDSSGGTLPLGLDRVQ